VPSSIVVTLSRSEPATLLAQLRAARYGHLLSLHILLLLHAGFTSTEIAACLFCSRSSVYRASSAWQRGTLLLAGPDAAAHAWWSHPLSDRIRQHLAYWLRHAPSAFGWLRSRWSCACLALRLAREDHLRVSAETVRRWLHACGYVWKRASPVARDDDPDRARLLARIRLCWEGLRANEAFLFADELDLDLLPKVGAQWVRQGERVAVVTPGQNQKCYLAAALDFRTGKLVHRTGAKKNRFLFVDLLRALDRAYPATRVRRVYVVVDNYGIHTAADVRRWLAEHPCFHLLWLPRYCPQGQSH
jgi:transposase